MDDPGHHHEALAPKISPQAEKKTKKSSENRIPRNDGGEKQKWKQKVVRALT